MISKCRQAVACLLLLAAVNVQAQSEKEKEAYRKMAADVRKDVWSWKLVAFENRKVPEAYSNYSTVVLAHHTEIQATAKSKFKFMVLSAAVTKETNFVRTEREMVKINDKAALEKYSEISYQEFARRANSFLVKNKTNTVIGIRLIKPDGSIQEVNTEEAVVTKDEKDNREAKLAISGLQIGDIIDYFIQVAEVSESMKDRQEYSFDLAEESPIVSYTIHGNISRKYALEYRSMNGAPELKITDDGDDFELSLKKENTPAFPVTLWMSPMRQMPMVRLNVVLGRRGNAINTRKPGELYKNVQQAALIEDIKVQAGNYRLSALNGGFKGIIAQVKGLLKSYNKQNDELPKDSLPLYIYYAFRWMSFYNTDGDDGIVVGVGRNYASIAEERKKQFMYFLHEVMLGMGIKCELILTTSKYGPANKEALIPDDYELMVHTREGSSMFFNVDGVFTNANFIPAYLEGQQAPSIYSESKWNGKNFVDGVVNIPLTGADANKQLEQMLVSFKPDMMQLQVKRRTTETGHMKLDEQKQLLLFEDYYEQERLAMGVKESLIEQFEERRKTKNLVAEYQEAFAQARKSVKTQFEKEIKAQFEIEPKDLTDFKVDQMGIRHDKPALQYSSGFVVDGWVKKAGNNYIVDIGKVVGSQLKLEEKQRSRTVDVYMPFARSLEWQIHLQVPDGYTLEGIEKLNGSTDNASAAFISKATMEGNKLILRVTKLYKNAFEPAANWQNLVAMLDAAQNFTNAKLLLKKKG